MYHTHPFFSFLTRIFAVALICTYGKGILQENRERRKERKRKDDNKEKEWMND